MGGGGVDSWKMEGLICVRWRGCIVAGGGAVSRQGEGCISGGRLGGLVAARGACLLLVGGSVFVSRKGASSV